MLRETLPIIDVAALFGGDALQRIAIARAIESACRDHGFFYATGHGIAPELLQRLDRASRAFFALGESEKNDIAMARGGPAWRGYFPVGGELTSGKPDQKEGIYFGSELGPDDARVQRGLPLHGANQFPERPPELRGAVLDYIAAASRASHAIMEGIALSLGLEADYFHHRYTGDPTILFRIFHYPSVAATSQDWSVGEHTDYGLLTLLAQDDAGGLQVKTLRGWIEAPPLANTLVCNIGDMLDRLTGGFYRSTPHRAKNVSGRGRLSFPFFFDPGFDAEIQPLPARASQISDDREQRWDRQSVHAISGTYGDYLLSKVSKVFPKLRRDVIS
ncbi:MAG: 2-oxoglutarate and iron-dependent oxygenase domain-containing protein [Rhizomicrobium sp.]|jgi:isopenicillin N synthase-like dioxygenase